MDTDKALTTQEQREHEADEAIIERGLKSFYEVGSALMRIRNRRSYRDKYKTFEDYCRGRWDLTHRYVNYQIQAAQVVDNLGTIVPAAKPTTESQCRPLTQLIPDDQRAVWKRVVDNLRPIGRICL